MHVVLNIYDELFMRAGLYRVAGHIYSQNRTYLCSFVSVGSFIVLELFYSSNERLSHKHSKVHLILTTYLV